MIDDNIKALWGEMGKYNIRDLERLQLAYNFARLERETTAEDALKVIFEHLPKHYSPRIEVKDAYNMGGVGL